MCARSDENDTTFSFHLLAYQHAGGWRGGSHNERTIARLKPGVTIAQAQAEISVIARNEAQQYPDTNAGWGITVIPFRDYPFGGAKVALLLLSRARQDVATFTER